jgi:hypothetical protein
MTARTAALAGLVLAGGLLAACSAQDADVTDPAVPPPRPSPRSVTAVPLGTPQEVPVASSFGPGTDDVRATVTVLAFRDRVAPAPAPQPVTPGTRWASAQVRVCRTAPVALGYPAWVLGDDSGRTAQQTRVLRPQLPQPPFPGSSTAPGCAQGWVTWVVPPELARPSMITFEQTRSVPGAWRLR